jgi:hypothetical protein
MTRIMELREQRRTSAHEWIRGARGAIDHQNKKKPRILDETIKLRDKSTILEEKQSKRKTLAPPPSPPLP